jgi:hypothetical protein
MTRTSKTTLLILGLLCPMLASCVDSDNPLSDPNHPTIERNLTGVWRLVEDEGEITYYHVGLAGENFPVGMMRVRPIHFKANGVLDKPDGDLLVFATTLGKNRYLNVTGFSPENQKKVQDGKWDPSMAEGYFIFKYEIRDKKLILAGMDPEQKEKAIKTGKIKGDIKDKNNRITDSTENFARLVAAPAAENLFVSKAAKDKFFATLERIAQ